MCGTITIDTGPQHGYGIALWLEGRRLVRAEWGMTENNRRARYYSMTASGRRELGEQSRAFDRYLVFVARVLALASPTG